MQDQIATKNLMDMSGRHFELYKRFLRMSKTGRRMN